MKAYYKRAKAYAAVWSEKEAKCDFLMVATLDMTLARLVQKELKILSERMKEKYWEDKEKYWNIFQNKKRNDDENITGETKEGYSAKQDENMSQSTEANFQHRQSEEPKSEVAQHAAVPTGGMDRQQLLRMIILLQDEGMFYIKEQNFSKAMVTFKTAIEYVDYLQTKVSMLIFLIL